MTDGEEANLRGCVSENLITFFQQLSISIRKDTASSNDYIGILVNKKLNTSFCSKVIIKADILLARR